jgi:uncharacterized membrane protein YcaP (DUF421 family)
LSGYLNISDIEYAILENSGRLSIIPKSEKSPITRKDLNLSQQEEQLPVALVLDGEIVYYNLEYISKDTKWLLKKLNENKISKIEDVFIAMLDSSGKLFVQRRKDSVEK